MNIITYIYRYSPVILGFIYGKSIGKQNFRIQLHFDVLNKYIRIKGFTDILPVHELFVINCYIKTLN